MSKHYQALLAGSLGIAGATLVAANLTVFQGKPLAPLGVAVGSGLVAAAIRKDQKHDLELEDYGRALAEGYQELTETLGTLAPHAKQAVKSQVIVKYLPPKYQEPWTTFIDTALAEDWVSRFTQKSKLVFGRTRAGKTFWLTYEAKEFYKRHPSGRLLIGDLDFGSANEDGVRNFWKPFGVGENKSRFIRDTIEGLIEGIREYYEEMQERLHWSRTNQSEAVKRWPRWKMILDELPAVFREAKEVAYKVLVRVTPGQERKEMTADDFLSLAIPQLLYRGLKQQIEVTFGAQGKYAGATGLNLQEQDQLNMLCLGSTALDRRVVGSIPGCEDAQSLIEKVRRVRQMPGGKYAAIAKIDDDIGVKVIPVIDPDAIEIILGDATNPVDAWLSQVLTRDFLDSLKHLKADQKATLTQVVNLANMEAAAKGLTKVRMLNYDPLYRALKELWAGLGDSKVDETANPELNGAIAE